MKPNSFALRTPDSLEEAIGMLQEFGDDAKPLAGGQSLVPLMNFRLAQPEVLVDLSRIPVLTGVSHEESGALRVAAMTTHRALEMDASVTTSWPMLGDALPLIGHVGIRNRGTLGGSLVHADPAAELPAVCLALDARMVLQGGTGTREVPAADFFRSYFTTAVRPEEILTHVHFPPPGQRSGQAWLEIARRHGDFALVGVAATVTLDPSGVCQDVRLVVAGGGATPVMVPDVVERASGRQPQPELWNELAEHAGAALSPADDLHATANDRRRLIRVLTRRALTIVADRLDGRGA